MYQSNINSSGTLFIGIPQVAALFIVTTEPQKLQDRGWYVTDWLLLRTTLFF